MKFSNFYCEKCKKDVSSREVNGHNHVGGGVKCGGNIIWHTYELKQNKILIAINNIRIES